MHFGTSLFIKIAESGLFANGLEELMKSRKLERVALKHLK